MRKRVLILPAAAIVITALCAYRFLNTDPNAPRPIAPSGNHRAVSESEMFELSDENNTSVRLKAFIGRHQILLAFFDGKRGVDKDPVVERLRRDFDKISATNTKVFAISTGIPQENRKIIEKAGRYPFPLLSDPGRVAHDQWGVVQGDAAHPTSQLFIINRAGNVDHGATTPRPVADPQVFLDSIIAGR